MHSFDDEDLEPLRRVRSDVPPASSDALNRGRAALLERAAGPVAQAAHAPARPRRARWAIAGTAVAAVTAGALVLGNVTGVGAPQIAATAEAAELLQAAADATITAVDPVLESGQFRLVTTVSGNVFLAPGPSGDGEHDTDDRIALATMNHDELYIPADRSEEWVWVREYGEPVQVGGPPAGELVQRYAESSETVRGIGGDFYGTPAETGEGLPTEGPALLQHLIDTDNGGGNSLEENLFERIVELLHGQSASAELRAASLEALRLIDGVQVTERAATIGGLEGVAIGRIEPTRSERSEIVVDPATGQLLGVRYVQLDASERGPAGTVTYWSSSVSTVVDEAP